MSDVLGHYHMYDYKARCAIAITTDLVREAQRRHNLDPITTIAVGRAITCTTLLASTLKDPAEYVHCSFAGTGFVRKVVGECNGEGHCRGYSSPLRLELVLPDGAPVPQSVGEALGGSGSLTVTRGKLSHQPNNSVSELMNGEIAADVARFLTESEQIPSAVAAGVKLSPEGEVLGAGGVLVQRLGGSNLQDGVLGEIEQRMTAMHLSDRIARGETLDEIVAYIQGESQGFGALMERPLIYKCTCTREKMANALFALGEDELKAIKEDTGRIEVRCQYCATVHTFQLEELVSH